MKKTALIVALAAGALGLAGCEKKAEEATPVAEATSESAAEASEAAPAGSDDAGAAKAAEPAAEGEDGKGNDVKT